MSGSRYIVTTASSMITPGSIWSSEAISDYIQQEAKDVRSGVSRWRVMSTTRVFVEHCSLQPPPRRVILE